ncbi:hypothetical protein F7725_016367 [Dissostichus mawsoni]|uniref:LisH domain-containing protein n=1 Tax=Dissostichus mawsoni TaxID=36200 RepID=A0A7J5Z1G7_DISMA|nr:hypothetical protein F7725_016367 [Dissostichus mawsoni]
MTVCERAAISLLTASIFSSIILLFCSSSSLSAAILASSSSSRNWAAEILELLSEILCSFIDGSESVVDETHWLLMVQTEESEFLRVQTAESLWRSLISLLEGEEQSVSWLVSLFTCNTQYLASLLLHKKFAAEFITHGGVQRLLEIPRPSMAATGVSLCLYYLAYNQDAMERVSTLQILNTESEVSLMSDDQVFSNRQTAKHTCMALRRYFEAHLAVKAEQVKQSLHNSDGGSTVPQQPFYKAYTYTREQVIEMMEFLIESAPRSSTGSRWSFSTRFQLVLAETVEVLDETRSPKAYREYGIVYDCENIHVLLSVLSVKMPITDADLIRALACKALVGLSRSAAIRQIISKLPLFTSSHIQQLMKEPLLQDKRSEHVRFCRYAAELTERVSGKPLLMGSDVSLARLQRANVVAQSRITFSQKELLVLIRNHLVAKGLHDTANTLVREANLPSSPPLICRSHRSDRQASLLAGRILFSRERPPAICNSGRRLRALKQKSDHGAFIQPPLAPPSPPSLDSIITEFLREQHARCINPVTTCPPFSLFTPHRCPEPTQRRMAEPNFSARLGGRGLYPRHGGVDRGGWTGTSSSADESGFTCCAFSARERFLMLGTCSGHLKFYNVFSGEEEANYTCHTSAITHLEPSRYRQCLHPQVKTVTHTQHTHTHTHTVSHCVFTVCRNSFVDDHYVEFSKHSQDRVIGTKDQVAHELRDLYPSDDMVLNDGVLWDVRNSRAIHKFDKFNMNISGDFHPNGLEVIINTEIADDEDDAMDQQMKSPFGSSFRTFDATDYKPIATVDVKRNIFDLCTDTKDCYLAVIEYIIALIYFQWADVLNNKNKVYKETNQETVCSSPSLQRDRRTEKQTIRFTFRPN